MELSSKEKAEELVEKYKPYAHAYYDETNGFNQEDIRRNSIQCAIIAIKEIIELAWKMHNLEGQNLYAYYNEVLSHLNKMVTYESRRTSI